MTLRCRFDDWVDVVAAREDPRRQMLKRKIRPKRQPALAVPDVEGLPALAFLKGLTL